MQQDTLRERVPGATWHSAFRERLTALWDFLLIARVLHLKRANPTERRGCKISGLRDDDSRAAEVPDCAGFPAFLIHDPHSSFISGSSGITLIVTWERAWYCTSRP
jgi:hypothetical protein